MNQKMTMKTSIGEIEIDAKKLNRFVNELEHYGINGMKWGYTNRRRNGKRTAGEYDPKNDPMATSVHRDSSNKPKTFSDLNMDEEEIREHADEIIKAFKETYGMDITIDDIMDPSNWSSETIRVETTPEEDKKYGIEKKSEMIDLTTPEGQARSKELYNQKSNKVNSSTSINISSDDAKDIQKYLKKIYNIDTTIDDIIDPNNWSGVSTFERMTVDEFDEAERKSKKSSVKHSINDFSINILEHYGVPGMKWGVRKAKPPSKSSKLTRKKAKELLKKKKKKAQEAERKKKILKNPTKLYKHRNEFSEAEIKKAMERFNWERNLRSLSKSDLDYGRDVANNILQTSSSLIGIYNNIARTYNSLGSPSTKWKYIENIPGGGKKDKKKDDD